MGSPPRRRGKEVADEGIGGIIRITSAWAGKSPACRVHPCTGRDHPRVGGEKVSPLSAVALSRGSPPHGRGKDGKFIRINESTGITPAWAGKSFLTWSCFQPVGDHPRVGGEKATECRSISTKSGSPPRGRGKVNKNNQNAAPEGITPAWAGKSNCRFTFLAFWEDHPRVGGEKEGQTRFLSMPSGSPPRGRGKVRCGPAADEMPRITPAWAGKRQRPATCSISQGDHPRVGGEKLSNSTRNRSIIGSPPHRRGKAFSVLRRQFRFRITPAWAGKSRKSSGATSSSRDHPRVGGEKKLRIELSQPHAGSPPRGRGKVEPERLRKLSGGITPAWAGKSA